jgi:hypothetical protein
MKLPWTANLKCVSGVAVGKYLSISC